MFSAELTFRVFDSFLDEPLLVEYFLLEKIDTRKSYSDCEQYEEIVPEHENLEILQELHDVL